MPGLDMLEAEFADGAGHVLLAMALEVAQTVLAADGQGGGVLQGLEVWCSSRRRRLGVRRSTYSFRRVSSV